MTWNLLHLAAMLQAAGGIPAYGNQRSAWDDGRRFDRDNPEYRRASRRRRPTTGTSGVP